MGESNDSHTLMAFERFSTGPLRGVNEDTNLATLAPGDLITGQNVALFDSAIGTRPGVVRPGTGEDYENATTGANAIQGMYEHRENFDSGRHLIAVGSDGVAAPNTKNIFYEDTALLPSAGGPTITAHQDNIWTFDTFENKTWAAGGAATNKPWYWAGDTAVAPTAMTIPDSASNPLYPKFVKQWQGYLLLGGLRGQTLPDNNPMVTRFVSIGDDPTDATKWKTGNTIGFSTTRSGIPSFGKVYSTGLAQYTDNNGEWLLILYNKGIAVVEHDGVHDFAVTSGVASGCVSQRAFVSLGLDAGDAIYMSDRGFHSLRQSQTHGPNARKFLSWKIRKTFQSLNPNRLAYSVGAYDDINGRVVFAVSTGSNTKHDLLMSLDVKGVEELDSDNAAWHFWELKNAAGTPLYVNDLLMARDASGNKHLYAGTTAGDMVRFSNDTFSDLGSAYEAEIQTRHDDLGAVIVEKTLGTVMPIMQPGGNYQPKMYFVFDYGERVSGARDLTMRQAGGAVFGTSKFGTGVFGGGDKTRTEKVYGAGSGQTIGFKINHSGANQPFRIADIPFLASANGEEAGSEP